MLNVLIADDDETLCDCLLKLMPWESLSCHPPLVAHDGREAWEIIQNKNTDVLICDLMMPVMGGVELCGKIRENGLSVEMILLSAYEDFSVARKLMQYGMRDYILKPVNRESIESLAARIREINRKKILTGSYFKEEYEKKMMAALGSRDMETVNELLGDLEQLESRELLNVGPYLLRLLYDYLCVVVKRMDREEYKARLYRRRRELGELSGAPEQAEFIRQQYQKELAGEGEETQEKRVLRQILRLVSENYANPDCNAAWIADQLNLTPAYTGKIFKAHRGVGLIEYITECRIKRACELLNLTNLSVNAVAREAGYVDAGYFTRVFREKKGVSPSTYREKM